jgi:hypothetical protein
MKQGSGNSGPHNLKVEYYAKSRKGFRSPLQITGRTLDNKLVVRGVFPLFSSLTGLPLDIILEVLKKNNMIVDWLNFFDQSIKEGWKPQRTINKIREAVSEVYGQEFSKEIEKRLNITLSNR